MSETARKLAALEAAHIEAEAALVDLKRAWRDEDRQISARRQLIWARHEQGARDRDLVRVSLGGPPLLAETVPETVPPNSVEEAASPGAAGAEAGAAAEVKGGV